MLQYRGVVRLTLIGSLVHCASASCAFPINKDNFMFDYAVCKLLYKNGGFYSMKM